MPAEDTTICGACGAMGQYGAFCEDCGAMLPPAEAPSITEEPRVPGTGVSDGPPADEWHERARALIVPVTEPAPVDLADRAALPVLPGRPEPTRPIVRAPDVDDVATGRSCPWCSTLNPVDRHFCRRCALLLAAQPGPVGRRPWWRRLLDRRHREIPYAGQRPRLRRGPGQLVRWLVLLVVAGVVAFAVNAWGGTAVANVEDHFAHPSIVFASTFTASDSDRAHPVADLHDGYNNTWWGTGQTGSGTGVYVNATFNQPINLLDIVITPGAGLAEDTFTAQSRPQTIKVALTMADGSTTNSTITLPDSPGPDTFSIHGNNVTSIRFTLESAWLASPGPDVEVAIAEIEFFDKS
jgi:hypothetical protein